MAIYSTIVSGGVTDQFCFILLKITSSFTGEVHGPAASKTFWDYTVKTGPDSTAEQAS